MPLEVVGSPTTNVISSNTTSHSVDYPADIEAGDLLLLLGAMDGTGQTFNNLNGFTELKEGNGSNVTAMHAWKRADGTETGTFSFTVTSGEHGTWNMVCIRGFHATSAPEVSTGVSASGTNPNPDGVTASWGAETGPNLFITVVAVDSNVVPSGAPTNYTNLTTQVGSGTSGASLGWARRFFTSDTDNPGTFTMSSEQHFSCTIVIRAAAETPAAFPSTSVLDSGAGSDGNVGSPWTEDPFNSNPAPFRRTSNQFANQTSGNGYSEMWLSTPTFVGNELEAYLEVEARPAANNGAGLYFGQIMEPSTSASTADGWQVGILFNASQDQLQLYRYNNNSLSTIDNPVNVGFRLASGDVVGVRQVGDNFYFFVNGNLVGIRVDEASVDMSAATVFYEIGLYDGGATNSSIRFSNMGGGVPSETLFGEAAVAGAGAISATGTRKAYGEASVAGSGTIAATGSYHAYGEAAVAGSGAISATGRIKLYGAAAVAGQGAISASGVSTSHGEADVAGVGAISATGHYHAYGAAAVAGAGAIEATGHYHAYGEAAVAGAGAISAAGQSKAFGSADVAGAGAISATGSVAGNLKTGEAAVAGAGSISATGHYHAYGAAAIAGAGTITATGHYHAYGAAAVAGAGAISATGQVEGNLKTGAAAVAGAGAISATGQYKAYGQAAIAGAGAISATGASEGNLKTGAASVTGAGAISATGHYHAYGEGAVAGAGAISATGEAIGNLKTGAASITGAGSISATGTTRAYGAAAIVGTGAISASGNATSYGTATVSGAGAISATGHYHAYGTASIAGAGAISATGFNASANTAAYIAFTVTEAAGALIVTEPPSSLAVKEPGRALVLQD